MATQTIYTVSPRLNEKTRCYYLTCDQTGAVNYGVGGGTLETIQARADEWNARPVQYEVRVPSPSTAFRDLGFQMSESRQFADRDEAAGYANAHGIRWLHVRFLGPAARYDTRRERI